MGFYVFQQISKPAILAFSSQSVQDLPFPDRFYPDPEKPQKKLRALRALAVQYFLSELQFGIIMNIICISGERAMALRLILYSMAQKVFSLLK